MAALAKCRPGRLGGIERFALAIAGIGNRRYMQSAAVAMDAAHPDQTARADDGFAQRRVAPLGALGILAAGEDHGRRDRESSSALLRLQAEMDVLGLGGQRREAEHTLNLEIEVAVAQLVEGLLDRRQHVEESAEQSEMGRRGAIVGQHETFGVGREELIPTAAGLVGIVGVEVELRCQTAGFGDAVGRGSGIYRRTGRVEGRRGAVGLALPEPGDVALQDALAGHGGSASTRADDGAAQGVGFRSVEGKHHVEARIGGAHFVVEADVQPAGAGVRVIDK